MLASILIRDPSTGQMRPLLVLRLVTDGHGLPSMASQDTEKLPNPLERHIQCHPQRTQLSAWEMRLPFSSPHSVLHSPIIGRLAVHLWRRAKLRLNSQEGLMHAPHTRTQINPVIMEFMMYEFGVDHGLFAIVGPFSIPRERVVDRILVSSRSFSILSS